LIHFYKRQIIIEKHYKSKRSKKYQNSRGLKPETKKII